MPVSAELLAKLANSQQAWDALVGEMGDTYSYAEENCVYSSNGQGRTLVEVQNGAVSDSRYIESPRRECAFYVNRYENFRPATLPALYAECEKLVRMLGELVTVSFDERNILQSCFETDGGNGDSSCFDACGSGFYVRDLTFGVL